MPVRNKTYNLVTLAGAGSVRPLPENPKRASLFIQNTSGVPGRLRFGANCQGPGQDITWPAGKWEKWDTSDTCPLDSVNLASDANCTWLIMEGNPFNG